MGKDRFASDQGATCSMVVSEEILQADLPRRLKDEVHMIDVFLRYILGRKKLISATAKVLLPVKRLPLMEVATVYIIRGQYGCHILVWNGCLYSSR